MKTIKWHVELERTEETGEFEIEDEATTEEIEECVQDVIRGILSSWWEVV